MRRVLILIVAASVLCTTAAIALVYASGPYTAGDQRKGTGVRITFRPGSFAVRRIAYRERCTTPQGSFRQPVAFVAGRSASLTGAVDAQGGFSGKYKAPADMFGHRDVFKVKGQVAGTTATIVSTEHSSYLVNDIGITSCRGRHRFHASLR
jgi:hypothetical protein